MSKPKPSLGDLIVHGGGQHGQVVAEAARLMGYRILRFTDDDPGASLPPADATGDNEEPPPLTPWLLRHCRQIVAIGSNPARLHRAKERLEQGVKLATIRHPSAILSASARFGKGVYIGPRAVVHTAAKVGDAAIVNTAAVVEHHCRLAPACHIAPGAVLGGGVEIGTGTLIGLNATVLPGVRVGAACIVAAGAVVTRDLPDRVTVRGNPAQ